EQQQSLLDGAEKSVRPTLSEVKKSWGFRRTTIARREFMEEIIDLNPSPPPARRARGRRAKKTPQTTPGTDNHASQRPTRASRSVIDELEWSAPSSPASEDTKPRHGVIEVSHSPTEQSSSDCIIIDTDVDQIPDVSPGQYDDAPEEEEEEKKEEEGVEDSSTEEYSTISDSEGYNPNALYCICRQKHNKRFMICCDSCQEWFHGDCVGISETQGRKMERKGQEYVCPPCTTKRKSQPKPPEPEPHLSLTLSPPGEKTAAKMEATKMEPEAEMETDCSLPLCIGPGCSKHALPDSVYCGTDCILQHAALTMKSLSGAKAPKSKGRPQRKAAAPRPTAKVSSFNQMTEKLCYILVSFIIGARALQLMSSSWCSFSMFMTSYVGSLLFYFLTANKDSRVEADSEAVTPLNHSPEDPSTGASPSFGPVTEPSQPQGDTHGTAKKPLNSGGVSKKESLDSALPIPATPAKSSPSPAPEAPSTSTSRHEETGALRVTKTSFVIPKKQPAPQPPPSSVPASASGAKPSSAPMLLNETRNLPVSPAPIAPSSRPSQPNNLVRQSIQRSLTSILFKRVCDCEDLEMPESEVGKLVMNIEMEMFDIFRNTDSKYMNKYRTIMFNLKDPKNKGLLYRVVHGEISPFRLVRMSQKDMQATKAPEPSTKETTEEQKKNFPPALKTKPSQPAQNSSVPDILSCMLKDTTSEHKAHLFDLKCKICTGQLPAEEEEPVQKKAKISDSKDKGCAGDDSPLRAPPDSPDMDSPTSPLMEPASNAPKPKTGTRAYTPVVIPAVSTVTITRRDPRTAASRSSVLPSGTSGPVNTAQSQSSLYTPLKDTSPTPPLPPPSSLPQTSVLPKSILMKPSSSADPRLYEIFWKGFLNMLNVAKFVTKGYLVSGSAENLKADLPDTIQIGGRIMPQTVWEYVARLKTSVNKELCVIRFHPATEEEEVAYVSLFSYFSSRGRFGVVANSSRCIKDIYLVPLSAKEAIPSILEPLEGPGLEKNRPNLLLGLAITQKPKRLGNFQQEIEEKRPKVHMTKDPMWIPKPPALYGSDKLEIFQPYNPETPVSTTPPGSPPCTGSPSDSSSSGSVTIPPLLTSLRATPPVSVSTSVTATQSTSNTLSDKNVDTASSNHTPLQTILKTLFGNKPSDSAIVPVPPQVSGPMVDPIVQQYGQKSKVKKIEEEENEFDRPYDPEEEYDPAMGYGMVVPHRIEKVKTDGPAPSTFGEDDVAYDPEDETIFEDMQNEMDVQKTSGPAQTLVPTPSATLTEQQRMLEELNKQIEEQKRQLKEQEEALRQQREAVGMFMAHFSVSDSLMSPPAKSLPPSQALSLQHDTNQSEPKPSEPTDKTNDPTQSLNNESANSETVKTEN
uniref:Death inducer-obliterator 1 n=1 Tax=Myripristis murdjan TaxID=586833 RepID=A0A667ZXP4_9TELE